MGRQAVESVLDAGNVLTGPGIHAHDFALLDKEGHPNHGTGCELGGLDAALRRIPFEARIGLDDLQFDKIRRHDGQGRIVPERDRAHVLLFEPLLGLAHRCGVRGVLLEGIGKHEMPELAIGVEILHLLVENVCRLHGFPRLEGLVKHSTGLQIADAHPVERLTLAGLHKFVLDNGTGITVKQDLEAGTKLIGTIRGHLDSGLRFPVADAKLDIVPPAGRHDKPPRWREELASAVTDPEELRRRLGLPETLLPGMRRAARLFPLRVPEAWIARIRPGDPADPLLRQVLPLDREAEARPGFGPDPVGDLSARIGSGILQKYAGRALLIATGACAVHCRYCFRRQFPYAAETASRARFRNALEALGKRPDIREVILSGGDPLSLSDDRLAELVAGLEAIPSIRRLRIHTRLPVAVPSRVDERLLNWLGATRMDVVVVLHVNHPRELDGPTREAIAGLRGSGAVLLNQAVLLAGVNDSEDALLDLSEALFDCRVMPYYLHMLDPVEGAAHFFVPSERAVSLHAALMRRLPGFLVPRLVRELAGTPHKIPVTAAAQ